ncbi:hypothetical protein [Sagittula sp.]|uniref:hypothetical protein n=1 Tax=Sagittula sp. TaxID=2038081 RepID=UPI003514BE9A
MANFILTYDLNGPRPSHRDIDRELIALGAARLLETVWWIDYSGTAAGLRDHLMSTLQIEDGLLVCKVSAAAWNSLLVDSGAFKDAFLKAA